jgi:hypothetical protein
MFSNWVIEEPVSGQLPNYIITPLRLGGLDKAVGVGAFQIFEGGVDEIDLEQNVLRLLPGGWVGDAECFCFP